MREREGSCGFAARAPHHLSLNGHMIIAVSPIPHISFLRACGVQSYNPNTDAPRVPTSKYQRDRRPLDESQPIAYGRWIPPGAVPSPSMVSHLTIRLFLAYLYNPWPCHPYLCYHTKQLKSNYEHPGHGRVLAARQIGSILLDHAQGTSWRATRGPKSSSLPLEQNG